MLLHLATSALVAVGAIQQTDTTFAVDPGSRLDVSNYAGRIVIRTWHRNAIRLRASHSTRDQIAIDQTSSEVRVRAESWQPWADRFDIDQQDVEILPQFYVRARPPELNSIVDFEIIVPQAMSLELGGPYTDVEIEGTEGEVTVKVSDGAVIVHGGRGVVSVRVGGGDVTVEDAGGRIKVESLDGSIHVNDSSGDISVETTDGEIRLTNVTSPSVEASSVVGDITFSGGIQPLGSYAFRTHRGNLTVTVPPEASARVTVATFSGGFETEFPVSLPDDIAKQRITFTLAAGDAQIELESFGGQIRLLSTTR
jgi:DUF4097 and DUF4098 domain-containing protein YvlB